jgi:hypothetical protein
MEHNYKVRFFQATINSKLYTVRRLWSADKGKQAFFVFENNKILKIEPTLKKAMRIICKISNGFYK